MSLPFAPESDPRFWTEPGQPGGFLPEVPHSAQADRTANQLKSGNYAAQNVRLPWWLYPIPGSDFLNLLGQANTAAPGAVALPSTLHFEVQATDFCILNSVQLFCTNVLTTTAITYTLTYNNAGVHGFSGLAIFARVASSIIDSFDPIIILEGPGIIDVAINNGDGGTYAVGMSYGGYTLNKESARQWDEAGSKG